MITKGEFAGKTLGEAHALMKEAENRGCRPPDDRIIIAHVGDPK